ncbi:zinc ribbon domain-containing protein [Pseudanabaena sp. PCC 6802]|uniref:zinc ribbon domain-containing protein n=1 Tax=Pseudanabaena sp. PCC 6802 TaxID=118173 RepID=UPI0012E9C697|nr:zinc ribbon domain-containing protein [Pseudanabaena sp. PCC 6802]
MAEYFSCPICGADVPIKARACPECGSDEQTGWSEAAKYAHLLPYTGEPELTQSSTPVWQRYVIFAIAVLLTLAFSIAQNMAWIVPAIAAVALICGAAYWLGQKFSNSRRGMERKLYRQLVQRASGDRDLANRLLEYEKQRAPEANRLQLLQNAIYRWDRDRIRY